MQTKKDISIVFGRFQPFHNLHADLIKTAWGLADHTIIIIGSSNRPRSPKNPFTATERRGMIMQWAEQQPEYQNSNTYVIEATDFAYSDTSWAEQIQSEVSDVAKMALLGSNPSCVVVGCKKDVSSYYLDMFPQWALHEVPYSEKVSATDIRDILFSDMSPYYIRGVAPESTVRFLELFSHTECYVNLAEEHRVIEAYKKSWSSAPYAPTFVTADAVVVQSGHILLIRRKAYPGKGLLALPGGFLDQDETIREAIVRELREETRLKVPVPVLMGSMQEVKVFDHPSRSERGRTITHAGLIVLRDGPLPPVKGGDDAASATWVPLSSISGEEMYEDHKDIIDYFKGRI